jgi:hypothetical protein
MNWITGIPLVGDILKTIFGSRLERDRFQADARSAVYQQFSNEFGHSKTFWDGLIDGINRLPRPLMTFGTIYLFWLCWNDPVSFMRGATALQAMPKEGWYILGAIVTFWFAAKLPNDFGKYKSSAFIGDIKKELSRGQNIQSKAPQEGGDPQEGLAWGERVEKRYKKDWDNLND